jgi:hypothetical protein
MVQVVIVIVFFVALSAGSILAALACRLPTAGELAEQDQARFARYERALRS